jgi:hypothetical protein
MAGKRDWSADNEHRKKELSRFIRESKRVLAEVGPPTQNRDYVTGRPPYEPAGMFLTNLLRIYLKMTYRDIESFLRDNEQMRRRLGLGDAPGRDTIHRYAKTIDEAYLKEFNRRLTQRSEKGGFASASTAPASRSLGTQSVGALPRLPNAKSS